MTSPFLSSLALALGLLPLASSASLAPPREPPAAACIRSTSEAIYRKIGYDHVVFITNTCALEAKCRVTTDVNPAPIDITVPAKKTTDVVTWRGSPAREFTPSVICKF